MKKISPLPASALRTWLDSKRIPFKNSTLIPLAHNHQPPQPRALQALELAMNIRDRGYNVYLSGEVNLGRTYMLQEFLRARLKKMPTPPDLLYVHNFEDKDSPHLISVPPGQGKHLKTAVSTMLNRLRKELPLSFENEEYTLRSSRLLNAFQDKRDKFFEQMLAIAGAQGFNIDMDDAGDMTLYPLVEGKRLSEQQFETMNAEERKLLRNRSDSLSHSMSGLVRRLSRMKQSFFEDERALKKEIAAQVINRLISPLEKKFSELCHSEALERHFRNIRTYVLDNIESFVPIHPGQQGGPSSGGGQDQGRLMPLSGEGPTTAEGVIARCEMNLFVDNSATTGAPLYISDHPTPAHLLGSIERESEMGALVTDFSLIKAGSLHKANGGVLILRMEDLNRYPAAWEGLLRALRSGKAQIEDPNDNDPPKAKGVTPEPVSLSLKVILVGTEHVYDELMFTDDRFGKLFKIKAQLTDYMPRNAQGIRIYLANIRRIIDEANLLPFNREALARLIDAGSWVTYDQRKLTLKIPLIRELMIEASAMAALRGKEIVNGEILVEAMRARYFRANLVEENFLQEYAHDLIKVETKGEAVGRVNGLAITGFGDFEFGLPHQIAATVGAGFSGIIDLERESKLGGPIHTKAMLILKSYLVALFAQNKPLILAGSLCFEQNYVGIEGDSASGAELAALLSALGETPIRLSLAFTGAVSQSGNMLAVGGVSRKIEGFFEVCRSRGLTGEQGVIIPKDNTPHLMLKSEVIEAVEKGMFHVYAVTHITEALQLLTGVPAGRQRKDGHFTPGSLYDRVDRRLSEFSKIGCGKSVSMSRNKKSL